MIFTERKITVRKGKSSIDEPVILYRGDFEVELRFTIMEAKYRFKSGVNLVDSEKASHAQLALLAPDGTNVFTEIGRCEDGTAIFVLSKEMIDELSEVGLYSFQIRLFDYYRESRITIPPVEFGIEVREPIAAEDHTNAVDQAMVGYSIAKTSVLDEPVPETFNANGQYNKTNWETGDRISEGKLNKIEDAIHQINQNELNDVSTLDKRVTNNFTVLDSTKANKDDVIYKGYGTLSDFNEETRRVLQGLEPGSINAVLGEGNVRNSNIADDAVSYEKIDWIDVTRINLCPPDNFIKDSLIWPHTGLIGANTGTMVSDYIKVTPGVTYSTNNSQYYFARYDQNKNLVFDESKHGQNLRSPWTCEEGIHFVRVTYSMNVNPMFNEGTTVLTYTEYENANLKFHEAFSRSITKEVESRIVIPDNAVGYRQIDWVDTTGVNLCPDNFVENSLIKADGSMETYNGAKVSDYIKVTPGVTYSTNTTHYFARYDENKKVIHSSSFGNTNFISPWTCEEGVHFVRVTYDMPIKAMFNEGEEVSPFVEYGDIGSLKIDEAFSRSITKEVESRMVIPDDAIGYSQMDWVDVVSLNLCPDNFTENMLIWPNTGIISSYSGTMVSDYIKVTPGVTYSTNTGHYFARYDENKNLVYDESKHGQNFSSPWTCEEGVHFVRVTYNTNVDPMFNEGEIVLEYTKYGNVDGLKIDEIFTSSITKEVESNLSNIQGNSIEDGSISPEKNTYVAKIENLFNPDAILRNTLVNGSGNPYTYEGATLTDFIPVEEGYSYQMFDGKQMYHSAFYDKNKKFVRYVSGGYYPPLVVPSGQNIGYVRLGFNSNYSLNTMVYKIPSNIVGTPEYIPFGETTYIFADDDAFIKAFKKVLNINDSLFRTNLPPQIELVEGDTFELFYDSILDVVKYSNYNLNFTGGNFSTSVYAYPRKIYYKSPSSTHTKAISLEWTDDRKNVVARADSNVVVYPKKNPSAMRNLLIIGDSLTDRQGTVKTLAEKMATNGFTNVRFIGTRDSGYNGAYHEGRSGWKISDYYSQPCYNGTDTSQPNPFWFDNECNFKKYCETNYFNGIDYAIIHLNWNDSWRNTDNMVNVKYNNLVQRLKRDYPNCKIILVSVPFRNALQYNTIWNSCTKEDIFNLNDAMQKYCESNENVHWVNTFMQCDSEYNTEMSDIQVNMRNTKTEMVCVDSVHPGVLGYQQIADAYYRKLNYLFNLYE